MIRRKQMAGLMVFLSVASTAGFYAALAFLWFVPIPDANRELVSMMLGNCTGFLAGVMTYHFGSSRESSDKNSTIGTVAAAARASAEALGPAIAATAEPSPPPPGDDP